MKKTYCGGSSTRVFLLRELKVSASSDASPPALTRIEENSGKFDEVNRWIASLKANHAIRENADSTRLHRDDATENDMFA